ncbi:hypothetical protein [Agrococcus jejuensis]|uniref:Uncharacterized protein n=1 Tax=Agrococcus jejuensis TaxID=399736 RepID=A0A1G8C4Y0_9MICO|nr:hypothetical protein [Agrococcus jejuensis]SDH40596.1 hypothetical protein SAMN04489720_1170 [Agrococcus jejuensis]
MSEPREPQDAADAPRQEPGVGAVPTWDWRAGTDLGPGPTTPWAPQSLDSASGSAWPTTDWAAPTTSWATPATPQPAPPAAAPAVEPAPRAPVEPAPPTPVAPAQPDPPAAVAPTPTADPPARSAQPDPPAWLAAGRVERPAEPTGMPRTIRLARRALWIAMGLAGVGVAITIGRQLSAAAVLDVAPDSASILRNLGGTAIYVGLAALGAAFAKRRRSGAIAAAALLAFVSFSGVAFLTIAPLPAAVAALILLLLPTSRAWLTIHPERIRRLLGEP